MAKTIDPSQLKPRKPGAPQRYPWPEWTDGQWREAISGEDYEIPTESFRSLMYHHARTHQLRVQTRLTEHGLAFCFTPKD